MSTEPEVTRIVRSWLAEGADCMPDRVLDSVLDRLPPKLRDLAERLKGDSLSQIARDTGVPRTTLYESVRRLRQIFERAGLGKYLESLPSA